MSTSDPERRASGRRPAPKAPAERSARPKTTTTSSPGVLRVENHSDRYMTAAALGEPEQDAGLAVHPFELGLDGEAAPRRHSPGRPHIARRPAGPSPSWRGKRASCSKNFSMKPRRVTEVLLPTRRQSSSSSVYDPISSSGVRSGRTRTPVVQIPPMVAAPYGQARTPYLGPGVGYGSGWPIPSSSSTWRASFSGATRVYDVRTHSSICSHRVSSAVGGRPARSSRAGPGRNRPAPRPGRWPPPRRPPPWGASTTDARRRCR